MNKIYKTLLVIVYIAISPILAIVWDKEYIDRVRPLQKLPQLLNTGNEE